MQALIQLFTYSIVGLEGCPSADWQNRQTEFKETGVGIRRGEDEDAVGPES